LLFEASFNAIRAEDIQGTLSAGMAYLP